MAEQRRNSGRSNDRRSNGTSNDRRNGASSKTDLSAGDAIARVRHELPQLLGRPIEAVLGIERDQESGWRVIVQIVELSRIPHSTDVLGAYAVTLDRHGELTGYQRRRRFHRNQADEE